MKDYYWDYFSLDLTGMRATFLEAFLNLVQRRYDELGREDSVRFIDYCILKLLVDGNDEKYVKAALGCAVRFFEQKSEQDLSNKYLLLKYSYYKNIRVKPQKELDYLPQMRNKLRKLGLEVE
jgi:hypothetical protein